LRKEKPIKTNNSANEINDQEDNVYAVNYNNRGNFQNNYTGNQQNSRGRDGYQPARGGYRGPQNTLTTATEVHHQLPKAEVHIEETVETKIKATEEAK
jgi:hypothetical protein